MDVAIPERVSTYVYDECNRLVRETTNGTSYEYVYGTSSHMLEKVYKNDCLVKTLKYENGMLTEIEKDGKINVSYDNYGNIKSIGSKNITYNKQGLVSSVNDIHFQYNYQGYRTKKIKENEKEVIYYLDNARIVGESVKTLSNNKISNKLRYYYDVSGICGIEYIDENNESHYYNLLKDSLGNVAKVMNYGRLIGEYTYDAWGNVTTKIYDDIEIDTIDRYVINNNPFRYKGYYYDIETNLYYCNARYYDPTIYQWLSPDDVSYLDSESVNGLNLYCYCMNDPVNYYDPSGNFPVLACILAATALVGLGLTIGGVVSDNSTLTAIGLGITGIAALGAGGLAIAGAVATGAIATGVVGGVTAFAGLGSLGFMSAEIQEATGNGNWIIDSTGMSQGLYNGFLLGTASIATLGSIASFGMLATNPMTGFTKHGLSQALTRDGHSVARKAILNAVKRPLSVIDQGAKGVKYVGKLATVVLNSTGKVITTWATTSARWRNIIILCFILGLLNDNKNY